jgi:hypothetical protein
MVATLLGPTDHPAELELESIDGGAEPPGVDLTIVQVLNLIKS